MSDAEAHEPILIAVIDKQRVELERLRQDMHSAYRCLKDNNARAAELILHMALKERDE